MLCMFTPRHVKAVKDIMGSDGSFAEIEAKHGIKLEDEASRYQVRVEVESIVGTWIGTRDYTEVATTLENAGALWSGYQSFRQSLNDAYLYADNPLFKTVAQPNLNGVAFPIPGAPMWFEDLKRLEPAPAPRFGQHTDEVLADILGLTASSIGDLHDRHIVKGPSAI
jgi:2-methylfumaryl-CoA isomerase